jgi:hypothetical protein
MPRVIRAMARPPRPPSPRTGVMLLRCSGEPDARLPGFLSGGEQPRLAGEGLTMLVVTHEMKFARDMAYQVVFMDGGRIVERGGPEVLSAAATPRLQLFLGRLSERT